MMMAGKANSPTVDTPTGSTELRRANTEPGRRRRGAGPRPREPSTGRNGAFTPRCTPSGALSATARMRSPIAVPCSSVATTATMTRATATTNTSDVGTGERTDWNTCSLTTGGISTGVVP